jgi:stearoyl-CoA desaturase (delta-9 desaturase)
VQLLVLALVGVPFLGACVALALALRHGISHVELVTLALMYVLTTAAVTVGLHRYLAHRAFRTGRATRVLLAALGSMAAQGPVIYWVANHRRHHQHADAPGDPHSPHAYGATALARMRGLVHAHVGWLFGADVTDCDRYAGDLVRDRAMVAVNRTYLVWVAAGLALPAAIGAGLVGAWGGAIQGLLWGGLVRIFLLQHTTFSINSICHVFGRRAFATRDHSVNTGWLALLSFGEAWHNNHHAFPSSARFGLTWWQLDPGALIIRLLVTTGLAWDARTAVPAGRRIEGDSR